MLAHKLGAQHPPQQAERRVGHAVGAALARLGVVVEHTAADIVDDAIKSSGTVKPRVIWMSGRRICSSAVEKTSSAWNFPPWVKPFAGIFMGFSYLSGFVYYKCRV